MILKPIAERNLLILISLWLACVYYHNNLVSVQSVFKKQ
jgi:hypothetical protein